MTTFSFEALTPEQALAVRAGDQVTFAAGEANQATVFYLPSGQITLEFAGRSLTFSSAIAATGSTSPVAFTFPDASKLYVGGEGNDSTAGSTGNDAAFGGGGDDTLSAGAAGRDLLQGNSGNDSLSAGAGRATMYGGQGDDAISTAGPGHFLQGNLGSDTLGASSSTVLGGRGDDLLRGRGPGDFLNGNLGDDTVIGSGTLLGEDGNDRLYSVWTGNTVTGGHADGGAGNDTLQSQAGYDTFVGGAGEDVFLPAVEPSDFWGGEGSDIFWYDGLGKRQWSGDPLNPQDHSNDRLLDVSGFDRILDWSREDHFSVQRGPKDTETFFTFRADSVDAALARATDTLSAQNYGYLAAQVGTDVVVFLNIAYQHVVVEGRGTPYDTEIRLGPEAGIILVGRTLADIDLTNFTARPVTLPDGV